MRTIMMSRLLGILFLVSSFGTLRADEGMWLPFLIEKYNIAEMHRLGCKLSAEQIYAINQASLKDAIVMLDGGSCTGEMISPEGLLLTNHHCGYDNIRSHSTV
ncbi:MAG: serine protease, partial [Clostridia bacterium]|nr:serine protease [Clostridia bacterium]